INGVFHCASIALSKCSRNSTMLEWLFVKFQNQWFSLLDLDVVLIRPLILTSLKKSWYPILSFRKYISEPIVFIQHIISHYRRPFSFKLDRFYIFVPHNFIQPPFEFDITIQRMSNLVPQFTHYVPHAKT
ncbi:Unknown protein, partial [Striga hermonthica]